MAQQATPTPITYRTQLEKIGITGFRGSQIIMVVGIGQEIGIFEYLFRKSSEFPSRGNETSISFTFSELRDQLSLQPKYLDAWLQMAIECGLFEIDPTSPESLKTAPFIYELLINHEDYTGLYIGAVMGAFSFLVSDKAFITQAFKTGELQQKSDVPVEKRMMLQKNSARLGARVEQVFSTKCAEYQKILRNGGNLLEVGCGFGYNLETWANTYPRANIVGIDIDADAIKSLHERSATNRWGDRITFFHGSTKEYAQRTNIAIKFDVILLSHVLHELEPDEEYRKSVLMDIYSLLKEEGLLIIADPMPPKLFAPQSERSNQEWTNFLRVFAQWNEVAFGAKFYDKQGFQALIAKTSFSRVELLQDADHAIWAIKK